MKINYKFPEGFFWGASSASYQVEGGITNVDWYKAGEEGKVPLADDHIDHYHRYADDFKLAKELGHNCTRISIEWARIEPEEGKFNHEEIEHYRSVIREIRANGMEPFVTLWHFTLPTWFSDNGGFLRKDGVEKFVRYSKFILDELHDECKYWDTINEPNVWASNGYMRGNWPPFGKNPLRMLKVLKRLAKSHIEIYEYIKPKYDIEIGIVKDNIQFSGGFIVRRITDKFWNHCFLKRLKGKYDHIGLNYYFHNWIGKKPKWYRELPKSDMGWTLDPLGIYHVLMDLKRYEKPVYVTEAGIADSEDKYRAEYIKGMVKYTHEAIQDGVDVRGFMYWSLMDNFEWALGYEKEFGLIHITKDGKRVVRDSAYVYKQICESNQLDIE